MRDGVCVNCAESGRIQARGLCQACYKYQQVHGVPRPLSVRRTKRAAWCRKCGEKVRAKGLCHTCYEHLRRFKKPRPLYLIKREACSNCGAPLKKGCNGWGRCNACYLYKKRTGVERPEHLWEAKHWCECGKPANHIGVEVTANEKYNLCDSCYALALEPVLTRNEAIWNR